MTWLMQLRLGIAAIGVIVWAYGTRVGDRRLGLVGIVLLAVALALRFVGRRRATDDGPAS